MIKQNILDQKIKSFDPKSTIITGYASVFDVIDQENEIISKNAFQFHKNDVKLLWQHDSSKPIGKIQTLEQNEFGLKIEAKIFDTVQLGKEAITLIKEGVLNNLSVGFKMLDYYYNQEGVKIISKAELLEVSVVTFPANKKAHIISIDKIGKHHKKYYPLKSLERVNYLIKLLFDFN